MQDMSHAQTGYETVYIKAKSNQTGKVLLPYTEVRSCNHCCCGKAIRTTYPVCVCVCL